MKHSTFKVIILTLFAVITTLNSCKKDNESQSSSANTKNFIMPNDSAWAKQKKQYNGRKSTLSTTSTTSSSCQGVVEFDGTISVTGPQSDYFADKYVQDFNNHLFAMLYIRFQGMYNLVLSPGRITWSGDTDLETIIRGEISSAIGYADSQLPIIVESHWSSPMVIRPSWICPTSPTEPVIPEFPDVYGPDTFTIVADPPVSLLDLLKCFNAVGDANASYSISLCADLPKNDDASWLYKPGYGVGHAFITMTKSDGVSTVTKSFGFYPSISVLSLTTGPVGSKMNDNGSHDYDAKITQTTDAAAFLTALAQAVYLAGHNSYDLDEYNCTNYAVEVFNIVRPPSNTIVINDWIYGVKNFGQTPNGLYNKLSALKASGDSSVELGAGNAPYKTGTCP